MQNLSVNTAYTPGAGPAASSTASGGNVGCLGMAGGGSGGPAAGGQTKGGGKGKGPATMPKFGKDKAKPGTATRRTSKPLCIYI